MAEEVTNVEFQNNVDSESQFSVFYLTYNLYSLDNETNAQSIYSSTYTSDVIKFLVQGVGLSIITTLGMFGNIFSIIVLLNSRMRSSISCFLTGLAVCDFLILLSTLTMYGIPTIISFEPLNPGYTSVYLIIGHAVPMLFAISVTALTGSVYFTLAVTVERYLVVCKPFLARRLCTWRRAWQVSAAITVSSVLFNIPHWFDYHCEQRDDIVGCNLRVTDFRKNPQYNYYYIFLTYGIVHFFFPVCTLVVFNLLIYLKIREANNNRKSLTSSEKETSLAQMLFIVVAVFILCNLMFGVGVAYKLFTWETPLPASSFLSSLGIFLVVLNSSLNFIIYCTYGGRFREVFFDVVLSQPWRRLTGSRNRSDSQHSNGSKTSTCSTKNAQIQSITTIDAVV